MPLVTVQVLPVRTSVPSNWNVPPTVVLVNEVIVIVPLSAKYSLAEPEAKDAAPAPLAMSKLFIATSLGIVRSTVVVVLKEPTICIAPLLDDPEMFVVVLYAVPLNFKEILLLAGLLFELFLHELSVKVIKVRAKNAHFIGFIIFRFIIIRQKICQILMLIKYVLKAFIVNKLF